MLNEDDYKFVQESCVESQRLFNKLWRVADKVLHHQLVDEGLDDEDRETYERHWLKLSTKVVDAISEKLEGYNIELLKNSSLEEPVIYLNFIKEDDVSRLKIEYRGENEITLTQIS